jgi:hypothetical protein
MMTTASLSRLPETSGRPLPRRDAATLLGRLRAARASRARRRAMWRELASYTTAGAIADIEAAVERSGCDDAETQEIRRFLAAQRWSALPFAALPGRYW